MQKSVNLLFWSIAHKAELPQEVLPLLTVWPKSLVRLERNIKPMFDSAVGIIYDVKAELVMLKNYGIVLMAEILDMKGPIFNQQLVGLLWHPFPQRL